MGGKPRSMKSETDELSVERKLTSGSVKLLTERTLTDGPNKIQTEGKLTGGPIKLQTEGKLTGGPIKLQTEGKFTGGSIKQLTEGKLTSGPSKGIAERKPRSVTNKVSKERKSASLTLAKDLSVKKKPTSQTDQTNKLSTQIKQSETDELSNGSELTFVCISDTHCKLNKDYIEHIPQGDVLLHTGDFTMDGTVRELLEFNNFLGALSHTYKVVIAGNHESCLEEDQIWDSKLIVQHCRKKYGVQHIRDLLTNCIYLEDEVADICGIKIYGSPWTPMYSSCDAFSLSETERLQQKWDRIPDHVDILMTHGPPRGFGDMTTKGVSAGCSSLTETVQNRVKPKYHIFGHIHEGYGIYRDEKTTFINASICTRGYKPTNRPVIFHLNGVKSCNCDSDKVD